MPYGPKPRPLADRIMDLSIPEPNSGCWIWLGNKNKKSGYSKITLPGHKHMSGHRASYIAFKGEIPEGMQIDHICYNPACVNPDHLQVVTPEQNAAGNRRLGLPKAHVTLRAKWDKITHCRRGHEYKEEETYMREGKWKSRRCKICIKLNMREFRIRQRSSADAF